MTQWPTWATTTCGGLSLILLTLHAISWKKPSAQRNKAVPADFAAFQREYLYVYLMVMFADWLQGPNMYTLYQSYGVDVGTLFMIGFMSSALSSGFVGHFVDAFGRKNACLVFCLLEILINLIEHVPSFTVLAVGRILGGISTSLLFSAFESWMVTEHRRRKFHESLLPSTFALASEGNGLVAILAGLVAQVAADAFGDIAPFQLAVVATIVAAMWILQWPSDELPSHSAAPSSSSSSSPTSFRIEWSWRIVHVGLAYSLFEVFLWVPALQSYSQEVPVGLVFSSFMLCIAIGGKLFPLAPQSMSSYILALSCASASLCMIPPAMEFGFTWTFVAFLLFEVCVGIYFPVSATLRADSFPEATMGTILTLFRLPTNFLVLIGTQMDSRAVPPSLIFGLCAVVHAAASLFACLTQSKKEQ
ncbi:hypothetical protein Ae201684P_000324 [Aphanomyces euteiches]|nr:hypothetical protein Ae201684P_021666 [Aphanomyces euteiches]KAH9086909.1 hypothetical protein Ae201684P_000324 [Aphanomyces euteiches]